MENIIQTSGLDVFLVCYYHPSYSRKSAFALEVIVD